jgi:hypothetical protein
MIHGSLLFPLNTFLLTALRSKYSRSIPWTRLSWLPRRYQRASCTSERDLTSWQSDLDLVQSRGRRLERRTEL